MRTEPPGGFINFKLRVVRVVVVTSCASFQLLAASRPGNNELPPTAASLYDDDDVVGLEI